MIEHASQARSPKIVVDEIFPHTAETVWKTLTTGELMARWLGMVPTGFEPVVGHRFTYQTTPAGEWDGIIQCQVLEVIPHQRFAYSWQGGHADNAGYGSLLDTVVTFSLERAQGGTRLRLVHSGFVLPRNDSAYRTMNDGWTKVMARIGAMTAK